MIIGSDGSVGGGSGDRTIKSVEDAQVIDSTKCFAFLVGVVDVLNPKVAAVTEQPERVTGVFAARHELNLLDARIH